MSTHTEKKSSLDEPIDGTQELRGKNEETDIPGACMLTAFACLCLFGVILLCVQCDHMFADYYYPCGQDQWCQGRMAPCDSPYTFEDKVIVPQRNARRITMKVAESPEEKPKATGGCP